MGAAVGGSTPYTWSLPLAALPPGLTLDPSTGVISGTPTTAGTFGFTVQVADSSSQVVTKQFAFSPPAPQGSPGSDYQVQIYIPPPSPSGNGNSTSSCSNYKVVGGGLPDGLTLDPTTGLISGTPTTNGTYDFTVQCTDATTNQTAAAQFTITITNAVGPGPNPTATPELGSADLLAVGVVAVGLLAGTRRRKRGRRKNRPSAAP